MSPLPLPLPSGTVKTTGAEDLYAIAAAEIISRKFVRGLMARAYSEANGEREKTLALYIRLRVGQLKDARKREGGDTSAVTSGSAVAGRAGRGPGAVPAVPPGACCGHCRYYTQDGYIDMGNGYCERHRMVTPEDSYCTDFAAG